MGHCERLSAALGAQKAAEITGILQAIVSVVRLVLRL